MATQQITQGYSRPAAADLSSKQYYAVKLNTSRNIALADTQGERVLGILQNEPESGQFCSVGLAGITKAIYGSTVVANDRLTVNSSGQLIPVQSAQDYVIAYALEGGASSTYHEVYLVHSGSIGLFNPPMFTETFDYYTALGTDGWSILQSDGTAFDGTISVLNQGITGSGYKFNVTTISGTETAAPAVTALGLDIVGDATDDDGVEISTGYAGASGRPFCVGTDPAFYFLAKLKITGVDGTDDLQVGFRQVGAAGAWDDYNNGFTIGCNTAASPMAIKTASILADAATSETDTTDTLDDVTVVQFKVLVSAAGVCTCQHDIAVPGTLAAPSATGTYTFPLGTMVVPFVQFVQANAAQVSALVIENWEPGIQ